MADFFRDGGTPMYATLLFGSLFIACSVLYALRPERRWVPLLVGLGLTTSCSGLLGFFLGLELTMRYLHKVPKPDQFEIFQQGFAESNSNLLLWLMLASIAALAISVGAFRAFRAGASAANAG